MKICHNIIEKQRNYLCQKLSHSLKVRGLAEKLGVQMTDDILQLDTNETISNSFVEIVVGIGKSEDEII